MAPVPASPKGDHDPSRSLAPALADREGESVVLFCILRLSPPVLRALAAFARTGRNGGRKRCLAGQGKGGSAGTPVSGVRPRLSWARPLISLDGIERCVISEPPSTPARDRMGRPRWRGGTGGERR